MHLLSNSAKRFACRPLLPLYNFSAFTSGTYRLGAVTSVKFSATENMPRITAKLRTVDYFRQRISAVP